MSDKPFWVRHVTEEADDHVCVRCCRSVSVDSEVEWLGPDDNYHFNLCDDCAQQLVVELWIMLKAKLSDHRFDEPDTSIPDA